MKDYTKEMSLINLTQKMNLICRKSDKKDVRDIFSNKGDILFEIYKNKMCYASSLCSNLGFKKSNVAKLTNTLVKEGLIKDNVDSIDRRIIFYTLTLKGQEKVSQMLKDFNVEIEKKEEEISKILREYLK